VGRAEYFGGNAAALEAMQRLESSMSQAVRTVRLEREGVDPTVVTRAMMPVRMLTTKVENGNTTGQSGAASSALAMILGFILYFAIILYGNQTAMSVIEEKTSRIMEVLASSVRPFEMLLGKVVGVGATGLVQLGIWVGTAALILSQRARIATVLGMDGAAAAAIPLPSLPPDLLVVFLLYFITGFLLYGALFAALGSMVNSMQESQQFMMPITLMIVFGFMGMMGAVRDPHSGMAVAMSYVPFFSPFVMPVRWSMGAVPVFELTASLVLMVAAMLAVTWLAGRIYRTGILMYGKKPSLREVWRWIKA
jgi:ABC-2 type transport system permease protein